MNWFIILDRGRGNDQSDPALVALKVVWECVRIVVELDAGLFHQSALLFVQVPENLPERDLRLYPTANIVYTCL